MRGGHCLNSDIPIDPRYNPLTDDKRLVDNWKTLLEIVSENDNETYGTNIHQLVNF